MRRAGTPQRGLRESPRPVGDGSQFVGTMLVVAAGSRSRKGLSTLLFNTADLSLGHQLLRISLLRLSEKGFEQCSGREFGCCTEGEMALWVLSRATLQPPPTLFGQSL